MYCVKSSCAQPAESVTDQWCLKEKIKEKQEKQARVAGSLGCRAKKTT